MQIQMNLTVVPPDIEVAIKKIQQAAMVNYYGGKTILTIWAPFSMSSGVLLLFSCTIWAILKRIQFQWKKP